MVQSVHRNHCQRHENEIEPACERFPAEPHNGGQDEAKGRRGRDPDLVSMVSVEKPTAYMISAPRQADADDRGHDS